MDQFQWHSKFLSADITEGGKKPIRCLMYFIKYIWIWSKQSKEHSCQGIMTNYCQPTNACRFFVYLFPTFICDDLRVINDVWERGEKKDS